eukprot:1179380-Prorocentrum_minimum.AAC.3
MSWAEAEEEFVSSEFADAGVVNRILEAENTYDMWTLMHRCNLCRELTDQVLSRLPPPASRPLPR